MNELTTTFRIESPPAWLEIGYDAENNWRTITINCEYWFNIDTNGIVVLMYKPACRKPAYPLKIERDGNNIVWTPESAELVAGVGTMQAFFEVDGQTIGASKKIPCEVDSSLLGSASGGTPPWAIDVIEEIKTLTGHYPYIADGKLYVWDSVTEEWVEFASSGGGSTPFEILITQSGSTYTTTASAADIIANADNCVAVVNGTKLTLDISYANSNSATLFFGVTTLDRQYPEVTNCIITVENNTVHVSVGTVSGYLLPAATSADAGKVPTVDIAGAYTLQTPSDGAAPFEIHIVDDGNGGYTTQESAEEIIANANNCVAVSGEYTFYLIEKYDNSDSLLLFFCMTSVGVRTYMLNLTIAVEENTVAVAYEERLLRELPIVTASDNGKFLRVVNGAWTAVPPAEALVIDWNNKYAGAYNDAKVAMQADREVYLKIPNAASNPTQCTYLKANSWDDTYIEFGELTSAYLPDQVFIFTFASITRDVNDWFKWTTPISLNPVLYNHIAPQYDKTATYAVGDYVTYGENAEYTAGVYRCTTAIQTAEDWNSAHWMKVTVMDEVASASALPDTTSASANDFLCLNAQKQPVWKTVPAAESNSFGGGS